MRSTILWALLVLPAAARAQPLASALDEGAPLPLETAVERALATAPALDAGDAATASAEADRAAARVGLFPTLQLEAAHTRVGGFEDGAIETPLGEVAITIPRNRTRFRAVVQAPLTDPIVQGRPRVAALSARVRASEATAEGTHADVVLGVTEAYLAYADARAARAVVAVAVERTRDHLARIAALTEAGLATPPDRLDAEARLAELESEAIAADALVEVTAEALALWLGAEPATWAVRLPDPAELERAPREGPRAEVRALEAQTEAAEAQVRAARGARWPSVGAYGALEYSNPNPNTIPPEDRFQSSWELGVYARWSPNALARANREIARAEADAASLRARRADLDRRVLLEVRQAQAQQRAARARQHAAELGVQAATRARDARAAELAAGRAVVTDLLRAEDALTRAELTLWRSRTDGARADARLVRARGGE